MDLLKLLIEILLSTLERQNCMKGKQLNIFDFLENVFCEDEPINEIVEFIEKDFEKLNLTLKEKEYSVWNNVPRLGKRLSMIWDLKNHKDTMTLYDKEQEFNGELNKSNYNEAVKIAEKYNIEISIAVTPFFIIITTLQLKK